jgi:putative spermidine/putrescine transport system substrate-binding protein
MVKGDGPMNEFSRRDLLKVSAAAGLGSSLGLAAAPGALAQQGEQLLVVMWGAAWIEVSRKIVDAYVAKTGDRVAWELHAGGAMAIVAKIKPAWPRVGYNLISGWDPVFRAMIKEDWVEPVTLDEMPALRDIPSVFFQKNAKGELMSVPLSTAGAFWGYRTDLVDKPIESIEQLLEPRFKGKLCVPFPVNLTGLLMLTLAMQRGGNERNIEPGWQFLKELAERGQIGRVINNNSEFINAMSSGETSVAFFNIGAWTQVRKQFPVRIMSKIKDNKGFLFNEGFAVIKQSDPKKVAAAKRLANHFATPEINEQYNWPLGEGPTNPKAKASPDIADVFYTPDELAQYAYIADFEFMASQVDAWAKRWEQEIAPLIRRA